MQTLLDLPAGARALIVFAHGAGAPMTHASMASIAGALVARQVGVLRFNFPYMELGRRRVDSRAVSTAAVAEAVRLAQAEAPNLPLYLGGHSFGGRMASHAVLEHDLSVVKGLVFCSFPLHPAGKPGIGRADHLSAISCPMLFLSGTRDALADRTLLESVVTALGERASLKWLDTADHGYRVLKRSRKTELPVFDEIGEHISAFVSETGDGG